jgi:hypothetical protein
MLGDSPVHRNGRSQSSCITDDFVVALQFHEFAVIDHARDFGVIDTEDQDLVVREQLIC